MSTRALHGGTVAERVVDIPVPDLLLDNRNPRLKETGGNQQQVELRLLGAVPRQIVKLACDIGVSGLDPSTMPIVLERPGAQPEYVVLEGNRRLLAIRILEDPDLPVEPLVTKAEKAALQKAAKRYRANPIEAIRCVVVSRRKDADRWIERRHTGENEGRGLLPWQPDEKARFTARIEDGPLAPEVVIQELVDAHLSDKAKASNHGVTTTIRRLISSPEVRAALGIDVERKHLYLTHPKDDVVAALTALVEDLRTVRHKPPVTRLSVADRAEYVRRTTHSVNLGAPLAKPILVGGTPKSSQDGSQTAGAPRQPPRPRDRNTVIPPAWRAPIDKDIDRRASQLVAELRSLKLDKHLNGCVILLRVLLELSVERYREAFNVPRIREKSGLEEKIKLCGNHLRPPDEDGKQTDPLIKAASSGGHRPDFHALFIRNLNEFVHNQFSVPTPDIVLAMWETYGQYIAALWEAISEQRSAS